MPELNPNKWRFKKINIYYKTGTNASKVILPVEETLISFCRAEERKRDPLRRARIHIPLKARSRHAVMTPRSKPLIFYSDSFDTMY
jgi:hypothetical protein